MALVRILFSILLFCLAHYLEIERHNFHQNTISTQTVLRQADVLVLSPNVVCDGYIAVASFASFVISSCFELIVLI